MPLQATSGAASYDAFGGGVPVVPQYIEEVFQTWLYAGNGSTQTITNGIDLSGKGGMVWLKSRSLSAVHTLVDTARGAGKTLFSDLTNAQATNNAVSAFNANGFTMGDYNNSSGDTFASWTFRKAPKFFDVVTYTGNGTDNRDIPHSLGSTPGCIMVKCTNVSRGWRVWHRSLTAGNNLELNATDGQFADTSIKSATSTTFRVDGGTSSNANGDSYVAYIYAHNAGGFGLTGTDNVISCGSYTGNGSSTGPVIDLGYEPQWLLIKEATQSGNAWSLFDNMRGLSVSGPSGHLRPNTSDAEDTTSVDVRPTATGFQPISSSGRVNRSGETFIYIAIRRGPMKVPTDATKVFQAITDTGDTVETSTATFPLDMQFNTFYDQSNATYNNQINDRLRGIGFSPSFTTTPHLTTASTAAETTASTYLAFKGNGMDVTKDNGWGSWKAIFYNFRRAPSFFDEVCWTSNDTYPQVLNHNLTVAPELIIRKPRSISDEWVVGFDFQTSSYKKMALNTTAAQTSYGSYSSGELPGKPTATQFTDQGSASGRTFVAYLFATCAGVSKVGSYTGNGSSQTINCGFTGGARFVLIKKSSGTGDWMVSDSARGIVSGNDPYLELNNTNAEVTGEDWLDTDSTGFVVNEVSGSNANTNGATYIFLAIA
jgi:hypothetical protein